MPNMAPTQTTTLDSEDKIEIIFGAIGASLALLAVLFAAATWKLQRRRDRARHSMSKGISNRCIINLFSDKY